MAPQKIMTFQSTCQAIRSGEFLEWEEKDQEFGAQLKEQWTGETPISWALNFRDLLKKIPPRFLTEDLLLRDLPNETGSIPDPPVLREIDRLIFQGSFELLPASVVTSTLLLAPRRDDKVTPLHLLAKKELLAKVPPELLTEDGILTADRHGTTPLKVAFQTNIFQIPKRFLTEALIRKAFEEGWPESVCFALSKEAYSIENPPSRKILFETLPRGTFCLQTLQEIQACCEQEASGWRKPAIQAIAAWVEKEIKRELQKTLLKNSLSRCRHPDI